MRLVILMGTQRSHGAYRLAWENSFSERIPFLPLHRRDLVSAEEGNKTFVGENKSRINWKKFEVMGEVILGIQRSQRTPHPQAHKYEDVERLILDTKLSGDEEVSRLCILFRPSTDKHRTYTLAACKLNHPLAVKLDARSLAGYAREASPVPNLVDSLRAALPFSSTLRITYHFLFPSYPLTSRRLRLTFFDFLHAHFEMVSRRE